ncbi:hypothetical protein BJV82DRAFT_582947 [Fennellomyces sp. T-0311]|nr:hypothetical protein BJV82DRAFT_582947 [Fennellomyces sp. T-0311]
MRMFTCMQRVGDNISVARVGASSYFSWTAAKPVFDTSRSATIEHCSFQGPSHLWHVVLLIIYPLRYIGGCFLFLQVNDILELRLLLCPKIEHIELNDIDYLERDEFRKTDISGDMPWWKSYANNSRP